MTISMHLFFHVLAFVLFVSFPSSFAHFQDVIRHKELDSKSSDSPSSAPSPYSENSKSGSSTNQECPSTCSPSEAPQGSVNTASGSSGGASAGSSFSGSGSVSASSRFDASAGSSFSGSDSSSGSFLGSGSSSSSASLGPSSSSSGASGPSSSGSSGSSSSDTSSSSSHSPSMGPTSSGSGGSMGSSSSGSSGSSGSDTSSSSSQSPSMGPTSSGSSWDSSSSDSYAPMALPMRSTSSNLGPNTDLSTESDSSSESGSAAGSDSWSAFSDYTGSDSASSPASSQASSPSGSFSDSSESGDSAAVDSSTNSGSSISSGSYDANAKGGASIGGGGSSSFNGSLSGEGEEQTNFGGTFRKVFAFGDSYTDTGNAQKLGIVKSFVASFVTKVIQTINPNFNLAGRSSNGRMVIDFLCDALNISPLPTYEAISADANANLNSGVNFAIGGSTSLSTEFFAQNRIGGNLIWQGTPPGFQTQIEWFNNYLKQTGCIEKTDEECRQDMGRHLIWLGQMGVDDYSRIFGSAISMSWLAEMTITHISNILRAVLESGAKTIVVQGLPPLGCCPLAKALTPQFLQDEMGCSAIINRAIMFHNDLLQKTLEQFRKRYADVSIGYADYFHAYKTIMGNLTAFGFQDGNTACCGFGGGLLNFNLNILCGMAGTRPCNNPGAHVHWDGIHLTEAMHKHISNLFLRHGFINPSFPSLCNWKRSLN